MSTVIKTFEVYNQPLFAYPDSGDMAPPIIYGVLKDEDINVHMRRAMICNMNMGHLRRFNRRLATGRYSPGYPDVGVSLNLETSPEIQAAVNDDLGNDMTINWVRAGSLSDYDWILGMLANGHSVQDGFTLIMDYDAECIEPGHVVMEYDVGRETNGMIIGAKYDSTAAPFVYIHYITADDSPTEVWEWFPADIPEKPLNESWYVASCSRCDDIGDGSKEAEFRVWMYNVATGTHPELQLPVFNFGSEGETPECFPAIPLRLRNVNYDEPGFEVDPTEIERTLRIFGVDANRAIREIFSDDNADPNLMDNVFSNFGVRVWDESEAGRQYLYTFFSEVLNYFVEAGVENPMVECLQTTEESESEGDGEEVTLAPDCSSITVRTDFSHFELYFAGITNVFYTPGEIAADPDLSRIYNSDRGSFYSSSGELLRPAGYTAKRHRDVQAWLDGGGVRSDRQIPEGEEGWDHLKPAVRISNWQDPIYNSDGSVSPVGELIPENVYYKYLNGMAIIDPEPVEDVREITYYAITPAGIDAVTVFGIGGQVFVKDTETEGNDRFVQLKSNKTNQLTVPFMFGLVENVYDDGQMHAKVDGMICSMHISFYVGDVYVYEAPWWVTLLKIIALVIAVVLIYGGITSPGGYALFGVVMSAEVGAAGIMAALLIAGVMYMISTAIFTISDGNLWVQAIFTAIMIAYGQYTSGTTLASMSLREMLDKALSIIMKIAKIAVTSSQESKSNEFNLIEKSYIEEIDELKLMGASDDYGEYSDITRDAIYEEDKDMIVATDPQEYFNRVENFHNIGFSAFDFDSMYDVDAMLKRA